MGQPGNRSIKIGGSATGAVVAGDGNVLSDRGGSSPAAHVSAVSESQGVAIGSSGADVHSATGIDPDALAVFARIMLTALAELRLPADAETAARLALAEVQREASAPEPQSGRIHAALERFTRYLAQAGQPAITAAFLTLAQAPGHHQPVALASHCRMQRLSRGSRPVPPPSRLDCS